jgi:hypothetical protein
MEEEREKEASGGSFARTTGKRLRAKDDDDYKDDYKYKAGSTR